MQVVGFDKYLALLMRLLIIVVSTARNWVGVIDFYSVNSICAFPFHNRPISFHDLLNRSRPRPILPPFPGWHGIIVQIRLGRHTTVLTHRDAAYGRSVHLNIDALDFNRMIRLNPVGVFYMIL